MDSEFEGNARRVEAEEKLLRDYRENFRVFAEVHLLRLQVTINGLSDVGLTLRRKQAAVKSAEQWKAIALRSLGGVEELMASAAKFDEQAQSINDPCREALSTLQDVVDSCKEAISELHGNRGDFEDVQVQFSALNGDAKHLHDELTALIKIAEEGPAQKIEPETAPDVNAG